MLLRKCRLMTITRLLLIRIYICRILHLAARKCQSWGNVEQWTCTSAVGNVGITSSCVYPTPLTASCPSHYNLTGGTCEWDGSGTAGQNCPTGTQYDPTHKCCTSAPGAGVNIPACPAGTFSRIWAAEISMLAESSCMRCSPRQRDSGRPKPFKVNAANSNPGGGTRVVELVRLHKNDCNT